MCRAVCTGGALVGVGVCMCAFVRVPVDFWVSLSDRVALISV